MPIRCMQHGLRTKTLAKWRSEKTRLADCSYHSLTKVPQVGEIFKPLHAINADTTLPSIEELEAEIEK